MKTADVYFQIDGQQDVIDNPTQFLIDSGLLFAINRSVLHPLGLTLYVGPGDDRMSTEQLVAHIMKTDDPEGFVYSKEDLERAARKMMDWVTAHVDGEGMARRIDALGDVVQVSQCELDAVEAHKAEMVRNVTDRLDLSNEELQTGLHSLANMKRREQEDK